MVFEGPGGVTSTQGSCDRFIVYESLMSYVACSLFFKDINQHKNKKKDGFVA